MIVWCKCGQKLSYVREFAGTRGRCPKCQAIIRVPLPEGDSSSFGQQEDSPLPAASVPIPTPTVSQSVPPMRSSVHPMNCPKCGKPASEYQANKWRCLSCGVSFIYEPAPKPDQYVRIEKVEMMDESSFFTCSRCQGKFPRHSYAQFKCASCGQPICPQCMDAKWKTYCQQCANSTRNEIGCVFVLMIIGILIFILIYG